MECCNWLLESGHGAELIDQTDFSGKTALHFAAAAGHAHVIMLIIAEQPTSLEADDPEER